MTRCVVIGNWILIQRGSMNGTMSFDKDWAAYRHGFGYHGGVDNYWRGLGEVRCLCKHLGCRLKVEVDKTLEYEVFTLILSLSITINHCMYLPGLELPPGMPGISPALVMFVLSSAVGKPSQPWMLFIPGFVIGAMF